MMQKVTNRLPDSCGGGWDEPKNLPTEARPLDSARRLAPATAEPLRKLLRLIDDIGSSTGSTKKVLSYDHEALPR